MAWVKKSSWFIRFTWSCSFRKDFDRNTRDNGWSFILLTPIILAKHRRGASVTCLAAQLTILGSFRSIYIMTTRLKLHSQLHKFRLQFWTTLISLLTLHRWVFKLLLPPCDLTQSPSPYYLNTISTIKRPNSIHSRGTTPNIIMPSYSPTDVAFFRM